MNVIVFGPERPKVSFRQSPSGSLEFQFDNERVIYLDAAEVGILGKRPDDRDILWADVYLSLLHNRGLVDLEWGMESEDSFHSAFVEWIEEDMLPLLSTDSERRFFDFYVELCRESCHSLSDLWHMPALIPQVWVNWIHYDPKSKERAERLQHEAFRVDYMLRANEIGGFLAIEIDGSSHFGGRSFVSQEGKMMFEASMDAYTKHLRKDRWLRKQGWSVIRVSNQEIDEIEDIGQFKDLFSDLIDRRSFGGMRLKSPWP